MHREPGLAPTEKAISEIGSPPFRQSIENHATALFSTTYLAIPVTGNLARSFPKMPS